MDIPLASRFPRGMPHTLILLSPLATRGGNYCTINRIRMHLESQKYETHLEDPDSFRACSEFSDMVYRDNIGVLIGIHAFRTGAFMKDCDLPYILILGGTDVNVFSKRKEQMEIMTQAVYKARFIVCFSDSMKERALSLWSELCVERIKVIKQAVHTNPSLFSLKSLISSHTESELEPIVFSFIGGIRPVKNPLYLVATFQEWHASDNRILLLIVGPKLDKKFATEVFEPEVNKAPGVIFIPGVPAEDAHSIMSQSFAVVNSSDSEGMCLALLEAMQLGTVALARNIPGNAAIIQDGKNGLLFDSPQNFREKAQHLLENPDLKEAMCERSRSYVIEHHSLQREKEAYTQLVTHCIREIADGLPAMNGSHGKDLQSNSNHSSKAVGSNSNGSIVMTGCGDCYNRSSGRENSTGNGVVAVGGSVKNDSVNGKAM